MKPSLNHRRVLNHKVICIPTFDRPEGICDFVFQTAKELALQNVVIILALGEYWRGISGFQKWRKAVQGLSEINPAALPNGYAYLGLFQILPFQRYQFVRQLNLRVNVWLLNVALKLFLGRRSRMLWIFHPHDAAVLSGFDLRQWHVHVDCVDWHTSADPTRNQQLNRQRASLYQVADSVTALTKPVTERVKRFFPKAVQVVPQGFDAVSLTPQQLPTPVVRRLIISLRRKDMPIVGYFGGVNSRLNLVLLEQVIRKSTTMHFLFIGPNEADDSVPYELEHQQQLDRIIKLPNVTYHPSVPRNQLLLVMQSCAALIIPYNLEYEFNQCCFPMKVMEYLYAERPVVSTSILSLLKYKRLIRFADTPGQFTKALTQAVSSTLTELQKQEAHTIVSGQTWKAKLDSVDVYLDKMLRST